MSEAMRFSKALYGDAGTDPSLKYTLQPTSDQVDTFTFTIDGTKTALKSGQTGNYTWSSATNKFAVGLKLTGGNGELPVPPYEGLWAPFRFFADADSNIPSGASYIFVFKPRVGAVGPSNSGVSGSGGYPWRSRGVQQELLASNAMCFDSGKMRQSCR